MLNNSITVIVRSANERTTTGCVFLLTNIFPKENVRVINVVPFSKAIKEMFEIGLREGKKWLFCVDADVLVSEEGVKNLIDRASSTGENVFLIQGLILDKFFSVYRPAGNHLYRLAFADRAISFIPEEGTSLRPETDMLNRMSESGYSWIQCDAIVGIHDYEQYYSDIYRKCFLQAHKHDWLMPHLEKYWSERAPLDMDYQVALWGFTSGKIYTDTIYVDKRFMEKEAREVLSANKVQEKENISDPGALSEYVHKILETYPKQKYSVFQQKIFPKKLWNRTIDLSAPSSPLIASKQKKILNKIGRIFIGVGIKFMHNRKGK